MNRRGNKKILKKYSGFSRLILLEFMKPKELAELDKKYTAAKIARLVRRLREGN